MKRLDPSRRGHCDVNLLVLIGGVNERDVRQTSVCRPLSQGARPIALDKL